MEKASAPVLRRTRDRKYFNSFLSGGLAGIVAKSVIAPFDRVKIIFQTTTRPFTYKEVINETLFIYRQQGFRGLWRGNLVSALRVFPYSAIQFTAFDFFQSIFFREGQTYIQRNFFNFVSGSLTGIIATSLTYPAEFVRTRMAMERDSILHRSVTDVVKNIYRREGIRAFYHGIVPSLTGIIPYHGTGFFMYHMLKADLRLKYPELGQSKAFDFLFGAIAGLLAQIVSYPFDVIRKKMQAQNVLLEKGEIDHKKGITEWFKYILRREGVKGFYKGITMNVVKGPLATGTSFMVKNILNRRLDSSYKL